MREGERTHGPSLTGIDPPLTPNRAVSMRRALREAKAALEGEVEGLRRRNDKQGDELVTAAAKHSQRLLDTDREMNELRADLKLRTFELNTMGAALEVRCAPWEAFRCLSWQLMPMLYYVMLCRSVPLCCGNSPWRSSA